MNVQLTLVLSVAVVVGALWGWRSGSFALKHSPERYEAPLGMSRREYVKIAGKRLRRRRLILAVGGGAAGAAVGFVALMGLALVMRR